MKIDLKNVKPFQEGNHDQSTFTITPGVLRQHLGEVLSRVMYCKPPHVAYVIRRGRLVAVVQFPSGLR